MSTKYLKYDLNAHAHCSENHDHVRIHVLAIGGDFLNKKTQNTNYIT